MAFKMKYKNSSFPFKSEEKSKKKKEIGDNMGFDENYNIFYDKDVQKSYEQRRGRFDGGLGKRKLKFEQMYKNRDISV